MPGLTQSFIILTSFAASACIWSVHRCKWKHILPANYKQKEVHKYNNIVPISLAALCVYVCVWTTGHPLMITILFLIAHIPPGCLQVSKTATSSLETRTGMGWDASEVGHSSRLASVTRQKEKKKRQGQTTSVNWGRANLCHTNSMFIRACASSPNGSTNPGHHLERERNTYM